MNELQEIELELTEKLESYIQSTIRNPVSDPSNRASDLGFPCMTYQLLRRLRGDLRPRITVERQKIFRIGYIYERPNIRLCQDAGIEVVEVRQKRKRDSQFRWPRYNITGTMDADIEIRRPGDSENIIIPFEHKSCSTGSFRSIKYHKENNISLTKSDKPWLLRYPGQLTVYMLLKNIDYGMWFYFDKQTGDYLFWLMALDYEYAETLINRAETIEKYVREEKIPEPIFTELCKKCDFCITYCFADRDMGDGYTIIIDDELRSEVRKLKEIEPVKKEYELIKDRLIGNKENPGRLYGKNLLIDDYMVSSTEIKRGDTKFFRTSIDLLGEGNNGDK